MAGELILCFLLYGSLWICMDLYGVFLYVTVMYFPGKGVAAAPGGSCRIGGAAEVPCSWTAGLLDRWGCEAEKSQEPSN